MNWLIGIILLIICIFIILIILPFVIDLNKFKPQIQAFVKQKLNANINFTSAHLTIFSGLGIEINNVSIENTDNIFNGADLFKVSNIKFKTEFFPLLKGKFVGTFNINKPEINLLKLNDNNNIKSLLKIQNNNTNSKNNENIHSYEPENEDKDSKKINNFIANKIYIKSFEIKSATLHVYNIAKQDDQEIAKIKDLNLSISNIGIDKDTKVRMSTYLDFQDKEKNINTSGLIELNIVLNTALEQDKWKNTIFEANLNANSLSINIKNAFVKNKSVPLNLNISGVANPKNLTVDNIKLILQSLEGKAKLKLNDYEKLNSEISASIFSNNLSELSEIFPKHQKILLNGTLDLQTKITGLLKNPNMLSVNLNLNSKLSNSDIKLAFDSKSLRPLIGSLQFQSNNLNLSDIVDPFISDSSKNKNLELTEMKDSQSKIKNTESNPSENIKNSNKEFSLSNREKKFLENSDFTSDIKIDKLIYNNTELENLVLNLRTKGLNTYLDKLNINLFSGNLYATANADLSKMPLIYNGNIALSKVKIQEIYNLFNKKSDKSPIEGQANIKMNFNAKGTTKESLSKYLNAKGNFALNDGVLNTTNLSSLVIQQFNKFILNSTFDIIKLDQKSFKKINILDHNMSNRKLKNQNFDFLIKDGKILLRNVFHDENGILNINADIGLDTSLNGKLHYTVNSTTKENLLSQSKYAKYLLNDKHEIDLEFNLSGTIFNPEITINATTLHAIILKNASKDLTNKIKEEIQKNPEIQKLKDNAKKFLEKNGLNF